MTETLQNLSNAMAQTVAAASSSIVRVEARRRLAASGIIWSADGLIVTAHHTVQQDDKIQVGLPDGQTVSATLVGRDPTTDLAVLRADAKNLTPLAPAAESMQVGHLVLALGRPGQTVQATLGIVSALGESWRTSVGGLIDHYVQTDVVMYPGFSGGPLINAAGQLLGLNTSALVRGVSLTVPAVTLTRVAEMLVKHGKVRRGYLGVNTQPVRLPAALEQQLGQETGLLLVAVEPGSPAEQGGLLLGDTIVALEGSAVQQHDDLLALLSADRVGQTVTLKIVRGGQVQDLNVVVGERN
ncbi:MAG TPA: trypsin-like peptidase domain-containing protein [Anaerolineae bacterium]|nr:trypsin-like peptidase domain-containing protein [Anaerolineae bacterium]HXW00424.1 trypsin-like peptidase domain-containing protein [Anaerolineae bacterium]